MNAVHTDPAPYAAGSGFFSEPGADQVLPVVLKITESVYN